MKKTHLVLGRGETGQALSDIISINRRVIDYDISDEKELDTNSNIDVMNICFTVKNTFVEDVIDYIELYNPKCVVVHSSVPVGTCGLIGSKVSVPVFHSPIRGKHPDLFEDIKNTYVKYLSFDYGYTEEAIEICKEFEDIGIKMKMVPDTKRTELGKLLSLARYGVYLAFAKEQESICESFGLQYHDVVTDFEVTRNKGVKEELKQPLLFPFNKYVGGHCVVEMMSMLGSQINGISKIKAPLLDNALAIDAGTVIWKHCNIYSTAKIGKGVSIGARTEIGNNVIIGNDTRVGANCFIPEGVTIGEECFIAPGVSFSNDRFPPSKRECWGNTLVKNRAMIGMGSIILPGIVIGEDAVIGAGSVVTKDVPDGSVWYGEAASPHGTKEEVYSE